MNPQFNEQTKDCPDRQRLMLNWAEVMKLQELGVEIGSHTHTHQILTNLDKEDLREQLTHSKELIEIRTKVKCRYFAYPNGDRKDFDKQAIVIIKESGYECALTLNIGCNLPGSDFFQLKRIPVTFFDTGNDIKFKILRARL